MCPSREIVYDHHQKFVSSCSLRIQTPNKIDGDVCEWALFYYINFLKRNSFIFPSWCRHLTFATRPNMFLDLVSHLRKIESASDFSFHVLCTLMSCCCLVMGGSDDLLLIFCWNNQSKIVLAVNLCRNFAVK